MKRFIHFLVGALILAIIVGQGALLIHLSFNQAEWIEYIDRLREQRGWGSLIGFAWIALVAVYLITGIRRRSPDGEEYLAYRQNGATVSILMRAVNEFIAKIGDEFAAIVSMKPTIRPRGRSIDVDLDIRVQAGTQIPELCQLLQARVRDSVRENLGLADIKKVRVHVKDIVGDAPPPDELREEL